jgi:hypothetical protein
MWKLLRISLLTVVLVGVASAALLERRRSVSWESPLWVGIYPVAGDDSPVTRATVDGLRDADFAPIAQFLHREGARYGRGGELVRVILQAPATRAPPARSDTDGAIANAMWSLALRWYARTEQAAQAGAPPHVRVFVIYHDPARTVKVPHSVGLQKGLIGVVHAFAGREQHGGNGIVIAHELLHTLGASDKYDPASGLPVHPDGYAEPHARPLLPQPRAEIMAGRRPVSPTRADMPSSLAGVMVGARTASEIRWVQ